MKTARYKLPYLALLLATALAGCSSGNDGDGILPDCGVGIVPVLTLSGPAAVAPGIETSGFLATLEDGCDEAIEDRFIGFAATVGTVVSAADNTDGFGRLAFTYKAPEGITEATPVTIQATATINGREIEDELAITVQPDTFLFLAPAAGAPISVGSDNAQPLTFQWTRPGATGGTQGVKGSVLVAVNNGARLVINNDALNPTESATVATSSAASGNFAVPVAVYSNSSGFVTLTVTDRALSTRTTSLSVQFVDVPSEVNLLATPLEVTVSPSASRFSTLELTVLNQASQPITGVDVTFELTQPASSSPNERVFPSGGTTNATGKATSRYEAGPTAGAVTIQACVRNSGICDMREITVKAATP